MTGGKIQVLHKDMDEYATVSMTLFKWNREIRDTVSIYEVHHPS